MGTDRVSHIVTRLARRLTPLFVLASLAPTGCTRYVEVDGDFGPQAHYRTGFPIRDVSEALERAAALVVEILVQHPYQTYLFAEDSAPTAAQLESPGSDVRTLALDTVRSRETTVSSGVVIASSPTRLTILGTDHSTHFPDTIVSFFGTGGSESDPQFAQQAIERLSIKVRQENSVSGPRYVDPFEILARSESQDLALIGVTFPEGGQSCLGARIVDPCVVTERPLPALTVGDPRQLSLGSFVYVLGYSAGAKMLTHAIVSQPNQGPDASFLIDGLWNEGMSGAPILAVRGDFGGLEWVGIARAASARTDYRLIADERAEQSQDPRRPYEGPVYLQPVQEIRYGVTFSVPMTTIRRFVDEHRTLLQERGFPVPSF